MPSEMSEWEEESRQGSSRRFGPLGSFLGLLASFCTFAVIAVVLQRSFPELAEDDALFSNLGFFLLINLNIIAVMVLGFLVVKNLVRLVLDRRRNILGSRLRSRLVVAFVGLSLFPTVLLFLVAKGIVDSVMQGWFSPQVVSAVNGAIEVARSQQDIQERQLLKHLQSVSRELGRFFPPVLRGVTDSEFLEDPGQRAILSRFLEDRREDYTLEELSIVTPDGVVVLQSQSPELAMRRFHPPPYNLSALFAAPKGAVTVRLEQSLDSEVFRGYVPIPIGDGSALELTPPRFQDGALQATWGTGTGVAFRGYLVVGTSVFPENISSAVTALLDSYDEYRTLRTNRQPLKSSYLATLVVVTLLIVFLAIWVGFYLARSLSVPIGLLAKATEQVTHGNLQYQIPEIGDDELSVLVRSFNFMTRDLREKTGELVARRRYMEAVLENATVGVLSVDTDAKVSTSNRALSAILEIPAGSLLGGQSLATALPGDLGPRFVELISKLQESGDRVIVENISFTGHESVRHIQTTVTRLERDDGQLLGTVFLCDDLTELLGAQRMAAWREVARRIAHEIKNPLTPIQLSAQRIQRRYCQSPTRQIPADDQQFLTEAADVIVGQVETLRGLVNEFSRFAQLPRCNPRHGDLHELIHNTVQLYTKSHPSVTFEIVLDEQLPECSFDPEQMGRVFMNLVDNALASLQEARTSGLQLPSVADTIRIETEFRADDEMAIVRVSDNGMGISDADRGKLFEPYFSTKKGGTGLGLAIVSAIMADHNGYIRCRDNVPRGATFVLELPVHAFPAKERSDGHDRVELKPQ